LAALQRVDVSGTKVTSLAPLFGLIRRGLPVKWSSSQGRVTVFTSTNVRLIYRVRSWRGAKRPSSTTFVNWRGERLTICMKPKCSSWAKVVRARPAC